MTRLVLVGVTALGLAACLDFDARFDAQAARLDGGGATGDGGPGSGFDAGAGDAGAPPDAGPALPSCDASLCEVALWTSGTITRVGGLVATSVTEVEAAGDEYLGNGDFKCQALKLLSDGGLSGVELGTGNEGCGHASGRPGNYWVHDYYGGYHVLAGVPTTVTVDDCQGSYAGWDSVQALSETEALFAGADLTLCRIDAAGVETFLSTNSVKTAGGHSLYPMGLYRTPSGLIYLASSDGTVRLPDAGVVSPRFEFDGSWTGLNDMAGTLDTNVWTVGYQGTVARLTSSGQFESVFDAGVNLEAVAVVGANDVWVGGEGAKIWHYDGQGWTAVLVPRLSVTSSVRAIAAGPGYLHLGGVLQPSTGFVLSFQRGR